MDLHAFDANMRQDGWALFPGVVPQGLVQRLRDDLDFAYAACRTTQKANGVAETTEGTVHHLPAIAGRRSFLDFLEFNPSAPAIARFFGEQPYILQSFGGNFNFPDAANYAGKVHRDIRSYFADRMMLNTLVTLDDVTEENGATWLLPGGHLFPEKPDDEVFESCAVQVTAPVGSILCWDSRVWHRAGVNRSKRARRIVTPIFTRPFYKPGLDYPRALAECDLSDALRQVLGFNARVPANLSEWYQTPEKRFYLGSQG